MTGGHTHSHSYVCVWECVPSERRCRNLSLSQWSQANKPAIKKLEKILQLCSRRFGLQVKQTEGKYWIVRYIWPSIALKFVYLIECKRIAVQTYQIQLKAALNLATFWWHTRRMRNARHASHKTWMRPVASWRQSSIGILKQSCTVTLTHTHMYKCLHIYFIDFPPQSFCGQPFRIFDSSNVYVYDRRISAVMLVNLLKMENCPFCVSIRPMLHRSIKHLFIFGFVHKYCVYVARV